MSKIFIGLAVVTGILVLGVAFLMWGYFDSRSRIEQNGVAIQELISAVAEHDQDIDKLYDATSNLEISIGSLETELKSEVGYLQTFSLALEDRIEELEAEWERLAALGGYREFSSTIELQQWLQNDPISEREYVPILYDCDNFAMDLTLAAIRDGRWIGLFATNGHLKNFTKIGNEVYEIEPQTDQVSLWGYVD